MTSASLDHLPPAKRRELARVVDIVFEEFADAIALGNADWRKKGRIVKIVLFGSYARGDWVDEPHTRKGYRSDFDLLIVVSHERLTDFADYWYEAAAAIARDKTIDTPVNFIVHTLQQVNQALKAGQYFFSDIAKQGLTLHEAPGARFVEPEPLSAAEGYRYAKEHFDAALPHAQYSRVLAEKALEDEQFNHAAFLLHQAAEHAYAAFLLTLTNYSPATHNLRALRSLAEDLEPALAEAWPREARAHRAWFNTLVEAYVKARYSKHYTISVEALDWLSAGADRLHERVAAACAARLSALKAAADAE